MNCSQIGNSWSFYTKLRCSLCAVRVVVCNEGDFACCLPCLQGKALQEEQCPCSCLFFGECGQSPTALRLPTAGQQQLIVQQPRAGGSTFDLSCLVFSQNTSNGFSYWKLSRVCVSVNIPRCGVWK